MWRIRVINEAGFVLDSSTDFSRSYRTPLASFDELLTADKVCILKRLFSTWRFVCLFYAFRFHVLVFISLWPGVQFSAWIAIRFFPIQAGLQRRLATFIGLLFFA